MVFHLLLMFVSGEEKYPNDVSEKSMQTFLLMTEILAGYPMGEVYQKLSSTGEMPKTSRRWWKSCNFLSYPRHYRI